MAKMPLILDRDDRHALVTLGGYVLLLAGGLLGLALLTLTLALCLRLFLAASGLGVG